MAYRQTEPPPAEFPVTLRVKTALHPELAKWLWELPLGSRGPAAVRLLSSAYAQMGGAGAEAGVAGSRAPAPPADAGPVEPPRQAATPRRARAAAAGTAVPPGADRRPPRSNAAAAGAPAHVDPPTASVVPPVSGALDRGQSHPTGSDSASQHQTVVADAATVPEAAREPLVDKVIASADAAPASSETVGTGTPPEATDPSPAVLALFDQFRV